VLLVDHVHTLADVVIVNLTRVDLVSWATFFWSCDISCNLDEEWFLS